LSEPEQHPNIVNGAEAAVTTQGKRAQQKGSVMNEGLGVFISPITLLLAGIFLAVGILSFMDLHFFKTTLAGKASLALGLGFLVLTEALFLTSGDTGRYFKGQDADVIECESRAEQALPLERGKGGDRLGQHIRQCMSLLGYEWVTEHPHCREAPLATNNFCYLPQKPFERAIVAFQMKFE